MPFDFDKQIMNEEDTAVDRSRLSLVGSYRDVICVFESLPSKLIVNVMDQFLVKITYKKEERAP